MRVLFSVSLNVHKERKDCVMLTDNIIHFPTHLVRRTIELEKINKAMYMRRVCMPIIITPLGCKRHTRTPFCTIMGYIETHEDGNVFTNA
jgi:hypothetical protein